MRKILFVAATALLCQAAYAEDAVAPAPPPPPVAAPAPAAAAPAAPAPETAAAPAAAAPATAAAPDATPKTAAKPAKKKTAKGGRTYQSDEARARAIASKYGVSW
jgi:hypothetical protein